MKNYFLEILNQPLVKFLKNTLPKEHPEHKNKTKYRIAAVILPLIYRDNNWFILFTKRTESVDHHRGEFSFPGGMVEAADRNEMEAALRETEEEIGVKREDMLILGALPTEITAVSYFLIHPFVGVINPAAEYRINPNEIERILEIPVNVLLSMKDVKEQIFEHSGNKFRVYFYNYQGDVIWGATGRILKQFLDIIRDKI